MKWAQLSVKAIWQLDYLYPRETKTENPCPNLEIKRGEVVCSWMTSAERKNDNYCCNKMISFFPTFLEKQGFFRVYYLCPVFMHINATISFLASEVVYSAKKESVSSAQQPLEPTPSSTSVRVQSLERPHSARKLSSTHSASQSSVQSR